MIASGSEQPAGIDEGGCDPRGYHGCVAASRHGPRLNSGKRAWVGVYNTRRAPDLADADAGRWAVVCEEHTCLVMVETRKMAESVMRSGSDEFCGECQEERGS